MLNQSVGEHTTSVRLERYIRVIAAKHYHREARSVTRR